MRQPEQPQKKRFSTLRRARLGPNFYRKQAALPLDESAVAEPRRVSFLPVGMQPAGRPTAPSRTLLRFLRSQTEAALHAPATAHQRCSCLRVTGGIRFLSTACWRARAQPSLGFFYSTANVTRKPGEAPRREHEPTWQERLWGSSARKGAKPLKPDDLPLHDDLAPTMFNSRRVQTAKAALEPRLRCTEVDESGKVILVDGEFKKTELIAKVRALLRLRLRPSGG